MKTATLNLAWPAARRARLGKRACGMLLTVALLLTTVNLFAGARVNYVERRAEPCVGSSRLFGW